ncbi:MAG: zinc ribbon domain-containing protein [Coriobacteriia bacterium]|nr:zinc ribbon domain-containing protein [Coriobacteriia bacterium]
MLNIKLCQSCGLQFDEDHRELIAKEPDGADSIYCTYCYSNGEFISPEATVDDMIEMGVPHLAHKIGEKAAREQLSKLVPSLVRWKED